MKGPHYAHMCHVALVCSYSFIEGISGEVYLVVRYGRTFTHRFITLTLECEPTQ